jgi:hypothetical protein
MDGCGYLSGRISVSRFNRCLHQRAGAEDQEIALERRQPKRSAEGCERRTVAAIIRLWRCGQLKI